MWPHFPGAKLAQGMLNILKGKLTDALRVDLKNIFRNFYEKKKKLTEIFYNFFIFLIKVISILF